MYHLVGLRMGSTKGIYLTKQLPWLKGQATVSWLCFPVFSFSSFLIANASYLPCVGGQSHFCACVDGEMGVGSPLERPWTLVWYMQTVTSLLSFVERVVGIEPRSSTYLSDESKLNLWWMLLKSMDLLVQWGAVVWCV